MTFFSRVDLAWRVLRGQVSIKNETMTCEKEHVMAGEVRVKKVDLDALQQSNIELGILRGVAATASQPTFAQIQETVKQTLTNTQR